MTVSAHVVGELLLPQLAVRGRHRFSFAAPMPMPKTSMHHDQLQPPGKNEVWFPWQIVSMEPKSIAERMQELANSHFRRSVTTSHSP
jgi:hypothetical protein